MLELGYMTFLSFEMVPVSDQAIIESLILDLADYMLDTDQSYLAVFLRGTDFSAPAAHIFMY